MGTPMMRIFCGIVCSWLLAAEAKGQWPRLRIHAINHAREGNDFANVLGSANPGDGAFQAQAEAGVGTLP